MQYAGSSFPCKEQCPIYNGLDTVFISCYEKQNELVPVHGLIDVFKESNLLFPYSTTLSYWFCALMVAKGLPVLLQCSPLQEMTVVTIFSSLLSGKERKKRKKPRISPPDFPHISPFKYCQRPSELQRADVTANGGKPQPLQ